MVFAVGDVHFLNLFEFAALSARIVCIDQHFVGQLAVHISETSVSAETDQTRSGLQFAADDIIEFQFTVRLIYRIDFDLVNTIVYHAQIFIVRCDHRTGDTRAEISLCNAAESLMENAVEHFSKTSVFFDTHHCDLAVMVAANKKEFSFFVC